MRTKKMKNVMRVTPSMLRNKSYKHLWGKSFKKVRLNNFFKVFNLILYVTILLVGVGLLVFGVKLFGTGFHNFDVAQNLEEMENRMNYKLLSYGINETFSVYETFVTGEPISLDDTYRLGVFQINGALFICIYGSLMFGIGLSYLLFVHKGGDRVK
jgi:hypothetical protein